MPASALRRLPKSLATRSLNMWNGRIFVQIARHLSPPSILNSTLDIMMTLALRKIWPNMLRLKKSRETSIKWRRKMNLLKGGSGSDLLLARTVPVSRLPVREVTMMGRSLQYFKNSCSKARVYWLEEIHPLYMNPTPLGITTSDG